MLGIASLTGPSRLERSLGGASSAGVATGPRRVALLRSGRRHGPLTRLITPWDIGELTRPFVFLGYSEHTAREQTAVGAQSGIATLTLVLGGALEFEGAPGNTGIIGAGGFKWTTPGEVVWHAAGGATGEPVRASSRRSTSVRLSAAPTPMLPATRYTQVSGLFRGPRLGSADRLRSCGHDTKRRQEAGAVAPRQVGLARCTRS